MSFEEEEDPAALPSAGGCLGACAVVVGIVAFGAISIFGIPHRIEPVFDDPRATAEFTMVRESLFGISTFRATLTFRQPPPNYLELHCEFRDRKGRPAGQEYTNWYSELTPTTRFVVGDLMWERPRWGAWAHSARCWLEEKA